MQRWLVWAGEVTAATRRADWLARWLGLCGTLLVATTWRLWTPQEAFPQVPLAAVFGRVPLAWQWPGTLMLVAGLLGTALAPGGAWQRRALLLAAGGFVYLMLFDQQRWQPWAYQAALVAIVLAAARAGEAIGWLRLFVVSFYLHSAVTKLDYSFLHTLGQQFLAAMAGWFGGSIEAVDPAWRPALAAIFPLGELLVAVLLLAPRTRTTGLVLAVVLHLLLIGILGPLGLGHKPAVLVWNLFFIGQDVLLFGSFGPLAAEQQESRRRSSAFVGWLVVAAMLLPLLHPWGWFDLWPSWGLYAASAERVVLQVHRTAEPDLPAGLRPFVESSQDLANPWLTLRLDRLALARLSAPIYPQNRSQLGVATAIAAACDLGNRARIVRLGLADRFTGERSQEVSQSIAQWEAAADEYTLNAQARPGWRVETEEQSQKE